MPDIQGATRRTPGSVVSVSIEETSSAKSDYNVVMACLAAAGPSTVATTACHTRPVTQGSPTAAPTGLG